MAFGLFTDGVVLPKNVDSGQAAALGSALAIDLALLLLFGLQHSVMARPAFKRWLTRFIPEPLERSTFVFVSALTLGGLMLAWQPLGGSVWRVESRPLAIALWTINALGWVGVPLVSHLIDHFDLFGLKQSFMGWRKQSYTKVGFVLPSLYRYVRHPMMTSFLLAFWVTPSMTVSHFVLALGMTLYIYIGVHFEERSLRRELGEAYGRYQDTTPKFVPRLRRSGSAAPRASQA